MSGDKVDTPKTPARRFVNRSFGLLLNEKAFEVESGSETPLFVEGSPYLEDDKSAFDFAGWYRRGAGEQKEFDSISQLATFLAWQPSVAQAFVERLQKASNRG